MLDRSFRLTVRFILNCQADERPNAASSRDFSLLIGARLWNSHSCEHSRNHDAVRCRSVDQTHAKIAGDISVLSSLRAEIRIFLRVKDSLRRGNFAEGIIAPRFSLASGVGRFMQDLEGYSRPVVIYI